MKAGTLKLDEKQRHAVLVAIQEVCAYREWRLVAAHVRSSHVHVVVVTQGGPEQPLHDLKAYGSRVLNRLEGRLVKRWATHGSTRYLWNDKHVASALQYVVYEQGEPMALYVAEPCQ